jgi:hypothetical protein
VAVKPSARNSGAALRRTTAVWTRRIGGLAGAILAVLLVFAQARAAESPVTHAGLMAWKNGNYAEALQLLRPQANQGDFLAEFALGDMYLEGKGVRTDFAEGMRLTALSAEQGLAAAQLTLAVSFESGKNGVRQNPVLAYAWFIRCAREPAMTELARQRMAQLETRMTGAQLAPASGDATLSPAQLVSLGQAFGAEGPAQVGRKPTTPRHRKIVEQRSPSRSASPAPQTDQGWITPQPVGH